MRQMLLNPPAAPTGPQGGGLALSEFSKLLTGELKLNVPVYTVWGACEDVAILEKIRAAPAAPIAVPSNPSAVHHSTETHAPSYSIPNLTVLSEATTRVLVIGGVRLRLFGLGGAVVPHKLFDNGEGQATIAGAAGTMWTTVLQIGELVDTAQRVSFLVDCNPIISDLSPGKTGLRSHRDATARLARVTRSGGSARSARPRPQGRPHHLGRSSFPLWCQLQRVQRAARPRKLPLKACTSPCRFQRSLGDGQAPGRASHRVRLVFHPPSYRVKED
jgi:hypothetical protein